MELVRTHYRLIRMQEVREGESPPWRWCGAADSQRRDHLEHHCAVFYLRRVRVYSLIVGDLKSQEGWELIALDDQEAEFRRRGEELIFSLQRDGEIEQVGERKVLKYSWSGQWWSNAGVQRLEGIARPWEAWHKVCET